MSYPGTFLGEVLGTLRMSHATPARIARVQRRRLGDLVRFARTSSPFYRRWYRGLPADVDDLRRLPPVDKPTLMSEFDDWVTDPAVTLDGLREDFLPNLDLLGTPYRDNYRVMTTSGTTGEPAVILHDRQSWRVMQIVSRMRPQPAFARVDMMALARRGVRVVGLYATGGHYGAAALVESARRASPLLEQRVRLLSVLRPLDEIVAELNDYQPTLVSGYPSIVALLASEQRSGRLHIEPLHVGTAGELMTPVMRQEITETFHCPLSEGYAATEVPALAMQCLDGRLHVNTDWYTLEPVDADRNPVEPGELSTTVLVSNLANRIQPIIRYDLGDRVALMPTACSCGSPYPTVAVEGRTNDVLSFETSDGRNVKILPLSLGSVIEETPGLHRFQAIATSPHTLRIRLEAERGADEEDVWTEVEGRVRSFLGSQGVAEVDVTRGAEPPQQEPRSGKLRQVVQAGAPTG